MITITTRPQQRGSQQQLLLNYTGRYHINLEDLKKFFRCWTWNTPVTNRIPICMTQEVEKWWHIQ